MVKRSRVALEKLIGAIIIALVTIGILTAILGALYFGYVIGMDLLRKTDQVTFQIYLFIFAVISALIIGYVYFYVTTTDEELTT